MRAVLIIASLHAEDSPRECLRLQDVASAAQVAGYEPTVVILRRTPLLSATLAWTTNIIEARAHKTGGVWALPSKIAMLRCVAFQLRHRHFDLVHAVNGSVDIALWARALARARKIPVIAEFVPPIGEPSRRMLAKAAAIIAADAEISSALDVDSARGRVCVIPDPHLELTNDAFTIYEFRNRINQIYAYSTRMNQK